MGRTMQRARNATEQREVILELLRNAGEEGVDAAAFMRAGVTRWRDGIEVLRRLGYGIAEYETARGDGPIGAGLKVRYSLEWDAGRRVSLW